MAKYITKRILYMLIVLLILSILMFVLYNLTPSNRAFTDARAEIQTPQYKNLPPEEREKAFQELLLTYQRKYGTDTDDMALRYLRWIGLAPYYNGELNGVLQGNFGYSYNLKDDVVNVIKEPMKNTIFINIFATIIALAITIPWGIRCAVKKGKFGDKSMQVFSIIGYSLPTFLISVVFVWLFCWVLPIFPPSGMGTPGAELTGWAKFVDQLYYIALPLIVMTFCSLGGMTRYVRSSMIEALSMDCIRTARAKGLKERTVVYSHAWRNALIPIVTLVIGWFMGIFSGSLVIEQIFGINGMGRLMIESLQTSDFDVVITMQLFYVMLGLLGNLIIDIAYGLVDPRVRVTK